MKDEPFEINIPFGDGSGFNTDDIISNETRLEQNQTIADRLIGTDEFGNSKIPNDEEWSIIDDYNASAEFPTFSELKQDFLTPEKERDDWEYYLENHRDGFQRRSMQSLGPVKKITSKEDKFIKIGCIAESILAVTLIASSASLMFHTYHTNNMKMLYPGEEITTSTIQKYLGYEKERIKERYLESLEFLRGISKRPNASEYEEFNKKQDNLSDQQPEWSQGGQSFGK